MKILLYNDCLFGGGVEKLLQILVKFWSGKHDLTIVTVYKLCNFEDYYPNNVKCLVQNPCIYTRFNVVNKRIKQIYDFFFNFKLHRYDVAIALKDNYLYKQVLKIKSKKKFAWFHTDIDSNPLSKKIKENGDITFDVLNKFNKVICISEKIKKSVICHYGDPGNLVVCNNPLDVKDIKYKSNLFKVKKNTEIPNFVFVGQLTKDKGAKTLFDVSKELEKEGFKFNVWFVGNGQLMDSFIDEVKFQELHCIKLFGFKDNPYPYIKAADWYISASKSEGYSYASQEAAVLEKPLILSDVCGARELLGENSEYGIIIQPDYITVYNCMKKIIQHPELTERYKKKIIERVDNLNLYDRMNIIEKEIFDISHNE